ncbi:TetR/AcrR family transcriptional regulator [Pseudomonas sp. CT11-2]|uniref:TetR/AcrR family transcriptional regulator n=1 Tax=Pseudomonas sp. CT11-2 TaxID=3243023 RepID=UPI0039AE9659
MTERQAVACIDSLPPPLARELQARQKAVELFALKGFGQVSMRELAAHVGIHAGSLYHHFESKEILLFEVIEELYETLLVNAQHHLRRNRSATAKLQALLQAHIALHEQKGALFQVAEHESRNLCAQHQARIQQLRQRYEEHFLTLLADSGSSSPHLKAAVRNMVSILNNIPAWLEHAHLSKAERVKLMLETAQGSIAWALGMQRTA